MGKQCRYVIFSLTQHFAVLAGRLPKEAVLVDPEHPAAPLTVQEHRVQEPENVRELLCVETSYGGN